MIFQINQCVFAEDEIENILESANFLILNKKNNRSNALEVKANDVINYDNSLKIILLKCITIKSGPLYVDAALIKINNHKNEENKEMWIFNHFRFFNIFEDPFYNITLIECKY